MQPQPQPQQSSPTPARISQIAWGYALPLILETAIRERIFDILDAGPKTVDEVSQETGRNARPLRIIMNALVGAELLAKDEHQRYSLTPESSTFLVSSKPSFLGGMIKHTSSQMLPKWLQLPEIVRNNRPARAVNSQDEGAGFFAQFVADLFPMNYPSAMALARHLDLDSSQRPIRVLDIAAGSGVWGIALAQASPQVRVTAVDWPGVLPVTKQTVERFHIADRYEYIAGDIGDVAFGSGYDIATLGHILHSEGEQHSRTLLKRVFEALSPGGTIAIAEFLVNDDRTGPPNGLIFAVNMLVNTEAGDTYSFNEIAAWLREAGFVDARTLESPGPSPLILATKP